MADAKDIKDMSNEELNAALKSDLNELDGKPQADDAPNAEPEPKVEPEPKPEEADLKPADEPGKGEEGADPGKGDEDGAKDDKGKNPYRNRIDRLLRKRDSLEGTLTAKEQRIKDLEEENARLKSQKQDDNKGEEDGGEGDEPITAKKLPETIHRVLDERESKSKNAQAIQQAQESEFGDLVKKIPNAVERKEEILDLAKKYPDLTFEALDRILAPEDHIDPVEIKRKDARKLDSGARSRADLEQEKDMTKATPAEQEKYLREQIAVGKLVL